MTAPISDVYARCVEQFDRQMRQAGDGDWNAPTPCTEWDVRMLVNHVVSEDRWVPPLLEGKTIEDVGDALDGDLLGDDPASAWDAAMQEAIAAAGQDGVAARMVHVSFGDISAEEYLSQVATDHVIHAWDLAAAIGADRRLDPESVDFAIDYLSPQIDGWRAGGAFGPEFPIAPDASTQDKLIAMTGRDPSWKPPG